PFHRNDNKREVQSHGQKTLASNRRRGVQGRALAQPAVAELSQSGFREDQVGVLSRNSRPGPNPGFWGKRVRTWPKGGGGRGGGCRGRCAVGVGDGGGDAAGFGPVITGSLLVSVLAGGAGGAAARLIGLGIPEDEPRCYEEEFKPGRTLVTVKADGRYDEAVAVIRRGGGYDRTTAAEAGAAGAPVGKTIEVHKEQLRARKRHVRPARCASA